jgi:hypothetical protein
LVYSRDNGRQAKVLTANEARRIAVARLPELLGKAD